MRGIESANRRLSRAVCGRSCGVFGLSPHGAVAGRAARAWPRVLYGAVLGLWSSTGDGASFSAASAASVAADVRWKKLTGMFGQPFHLTCSLCSACLSGAAGLRPARFGLVEDCWCGRRFFGGLATEVCWCITSYKTLGLPRLLEWHRPTAILGHRLHAIVLSWCSSIGGVTGAGVF